MLRIILFGLTLALVATSSVAAPSDTLQQLFDEY
jgi:hypothetical protein